jgi:hypothetical protein
MGTTFTVATRKSVTGQLVQVRLVRAGDDVIGFVGTNGDGYVFGHVLTDPDADTGRGADGHRAIGYCLPPCQEEAMAELVADEWSKLPSVTALRGMGVGGWPLVMVAGERRLTCPHCGSFEISISVRPGVYGSGPGRSWRMGDPGGRDFAYCHACGKASDRDGR